MAREQGLIQQAYHPGNDGYISEVKNVPVEAPSRGFDVKQHEIGHPAIGQPVDGVADGPADDQAERQRRELELRPAPARPTARRPPPP